MKQSTFYNGVSKYSRLVISKLWPFTEAFGFLVMLAMLLPASVGQAAGQDGRVDTTFQSGNGPSSSVHSIALQNDGKTLIGGDFTAYNGAGRNRIARLNPDGSLDSSFNPGSGANKAVHSIALQNNGKTLIGGYFTAYNGASRNRIARLNPDGSLDSSFNVGSGADGLVSSIVLQNDGKIIIGGAFGYYNGIARNNIARLNPDGSLDSSFNVGSGADSLVSSIVLQNDGKIIIGGYFTAYNGAGRNRIARLNPDGSLDPSFNPGTGVGNQVHNIALQNDGKIIIGGQFGTYNGIVRYHLARLNGDGSLDSSFNPGSGPDGYVKSLVLQSDGKIIICGYFSSYNGTARKWLARLNPDGNLDSSFNPGSGPDAFVHKVVVQSDDKIIIGGSFTSYNGAGVNKIARLNPDSNLDTNFNAGSGVNGNVYGLAVQSDDKIIIGGSFTSYNGAGVNKIARLNPDGSLDSSFNPGSGANSDMYSIAVQSDGKIIIGGSFTSYNGAARNHIARLNPDGSLDSSFNPGSGVNSGVSNMALQNDGKIIIGGDFTTYNGTPRNHIARLNPDGSLDSSFNVGSGADGLVSSIALQNDGKIIIGGAFSHYKGAGVNKIARLNNDGSLDLSFNPGSGADNVVYSMALQSDGKIIICGYFSSYNGTARKWLARLNPDGSLDSSFNVSNGADDYVLNLVLQSDGKIIIGGGFTIYNGASRNRIARLNTDGSLDSNFNPGGSANYSIENIALQSTGKVIIAGMFSAVDNHTRDHIARLENTVQAPPDLSLTSSLNPALEGASVIFTATINPRTASGLVTFTFNNLNPATAPLVNGVATYTTNTLPAGSYTVTAAYSGDNNYPGSTSQPYNQVIVLPCLIVTSLTDDGKATTCGTFSAALDKATSGLTIVFALSSGNQITLSGTLTPIVKAGVTIDGGPTGVILNGNGVNSDGVHLAGNNTLRNLTIRGFGRRELIVEGKAVRMSRVRVES